MGLELIPAYGRQEEIMTLFTEYTDMLMEADPTVRQYLILQHYEKELERPESKYGMPEGRLYLAYWDGHRHVLLDTLPFLHSAIRLYRKIGFYEIDCYNNSPMETTIFLQYDL